MRKWLVWAAIAVWITAYVVIALGVVPAVKHFGAIQTTAALFPLTAAWGTVFYVLLCAEGSLDRYQKQLIRLRRARERGLLAKIKSWVCCRPKEPLISPVWIVAIFTFLGAFYGDLALRLVLPNGISWRALLLIWLGAATNTIFRVAAAQPLVSLWLCIERLLGGG